MYGSYGMYSGNKCNFSSSTMYKPAGIVNITSGYLNPLQNASKLNGVNTSAPTFSNTSVISGFKQNSLQQTTDVSYSAQHIDYQQNPSPVTVSVRQLDSGKTIYPDVSTNPLTGAIQVNLGHYVEQYTLPGISVPISSNITNQNTTVPPQTFTK